MENEYDLLKRHLRGTYVKREKFPLYYAPPCKKAASIKSCARRLPEAVVKVASYIKTPAEAKNALLYIARKSEGLERDALVRNESLDTLPVSEFGNEIASYAFKQHRKNGNQMVHLIVSFPKRMNVSEQDAYRFMERYMEPFGERGYRYLYAVHSHQSATHGHVLLCLSNGRERLHIKKPQLIMLRQHQVKVAKEFGWEMQATRFQDRDFSLTGFIAPTKKKTLLERQVPQWCARRQAEKQHPPPAVQYDIGGQAQRVLSAWSKNFSNPARAEQLFIEMYAEKPKTALWYANHRVNVFGECETQPDSKLTEHNLAALQKVALAEASITSHAYFHPDISSRERADTL